MNEPKNTIRIHEKGTGFQGNVGKGLQGDQGKTKRTGFADCPEIGGFMGAIIGFFLGLFIGAPFGVLVMGLMVAARDEERDEKY